MLLNIFNVAIDNKQLSALIRFQKQILVYPLGLPEDNFDIKIIKYLSKYTKL